MTLIINAEMPERLESSLTELHHVAVAEPEPPSDPFDVAQRFIDLCRSDRPSTALIRTGFQNSMKAFGFRYFACCAHVDPQNPPPQAIMIHNYPSAWMRRVSEEELYKIDPIWQRAERDPVPFFWDSVLLSQHIKPAQRKLLAESADFGLSHGYTAPIHLSWQPGAVRASCSVVSETMAVNPRDYCMVDTIANALYAAMNRVQPPARTASIVLSRRERQCLSLAAQGKDDWAIGLLLGLSPTTVHSYFKRLMQRLGVRTRVQAIVWALEAGRIPFRDLPSSPSQSSDRRIAPL